MATITPLWAKESLQIKPAAFEKLAPSSKNWASSVILQPYTTNVFAYKKEFRSIVVSFANATSILKGVAFISNEVSGNWAAASQVKPTAFSIGTKHPGYWTIPAKTMKSEARNLYSFKRLKGLDVQVVNQSTFYWGN